MSVGTRVRWNPGYGADWTGTVVDVAKISLVFIAGALVDVLVRWDHGPEFWQPTVELRLF